MNPALRAIVFTAMRSGRVSVSAWWIPAASFPTTRRSIPTEIYRQAEVALEEADVIVMVVDGRTELASPDIELARLLQRTGKPLILAVNKIDDPKLESYVEDFRRLGIKTMMPISAEHSTGCCGTAGRSCWSGFPSVRLNLSKKRRWRLSIFPAKKTTPPVEGFEADASSRKR